MAKLSRNAIIGYPAGIITGITYGLNPLFAKPLMNNGASTDKVKELVHQLRLLHFRDVYWTIVDTTRLLLLSSSPQE